MHVIEVHSLDHPGLEPYSGVAGKTLRSTSGDVIIAESPKVIARALEAGLEPLSLLCEKKHIAGDAAGIIAAIGDCPVFTGERDILASLTGYTLTRGVLCALRRPVFPSPASLLAGSRRLCVVYDVCDATNIGVIFRTAAALGYDGILISPGSCDPFNRRAIRVSMGTVFQIPWTFDASVMADLRDAGFESVSMALSHESVFLQDFEVRQEGKYALILGSEGYGLPSDIIDSSDIVVKIPMHYGVDSLNVGAAAAISLWHFRPFKN